MKGLWSMKPSTSSEYDKYLAVSFLSETRFLAIEDEELEETEIDSFDSKTQTIYCGNFHENYLIQVKKKLIFFYLFIFFKFHQVTHESISVVESNGFQKVTDWKPSEGKKINIVGCNNTQLCISQGNVISYFELKDKKLTKIVQKTLENEIASIDLTPLQNETVSGVVAVGFWTSLSVSLLLLPSLEVLNSLELGSGAIPKSLLFNTFESQDYLFVGKKKKNFDFFK
jgi:DNA damage-binding protein 1